MRKIEGFDIGFWTGVLLSFWVVSCLSNGTSKIFMLLFGLFLLFLGKYISDHYVLQ